MKKKKVLLTIAIVVAFIATLLFGIFHPSSKSNSSVENFHIFSGVYEDRIQGQLAYLKKMCPQASVEITCIPSGKIVSRVLTEGEDTIADLIIGVGSAHAATLKASNMLMPVDLGLSYRDEFVDIDNMMHATGVFGGAFFLNTREMERYNLPVPASFKDLMNPIYKNHIVLCNPQTSGTGYMFVYAILNYYGEEEGWKTLDGIDKNIFMYGETGSAPTTMIKRGEVPIALGMDYDGLKLQDSGDPVQVIFPAEGIPYDYENVLLINKKSQPSETAISLIKAIATPRNDNPFNNMYKLSAFTDIENSDPRYGNRKLLNMRGIGDVENKNRILTIWAERYE